MCRSTKSTTTMILGTCSTLQSFCSSKYFIKLHIVQHFDKLKDNIQYFFKFILVCEVGIKEVLGILRFIQSDIHLDINFWN